MTSPKVVAAMGREYDAGVPLLPGADAAVRHMADRAPLGLASSSPRQLIDRVLQVTGWAPLFAVTRSTEEVARGKPAPDVYVDVVAALGVAPGDAVAVEDSTNGVRAALAAGLHVVAVPRPEYPVDPEVLDRAAAVLDDLAGLTRLAPPYGGGGVGPVCGAQESCPPGRPTLTGRRAGAEGRGRRHAPAAAGREEEP